MEGWSRRIVMSLGPAWAIEWDLNRYGVTYTTEKSGGRRVKQSKLSSSDRKISCQSGYKRLCLKTAHTPKIVRMLYIYETNLKGFKCVCDLCKSYGVQQFRDGWAVSWVSIQILSPNKWIRSLTSLSLFLLMWPGRDSDTFPPGWL